MVIKWPNYRNSSIHKSGFKMLVEKKMSRDATEWTKVCDVVFKHAVCWTDTQNHEATVCILISILSTKTELVHPSQDNCTSGLQKSNKDCTNHHMVPTIQMMNMITRYSRKCHIQQSMNISNKYIHVIISAALKNQDFFPPKQHTVIFFSLFIDKC